MSQNGNELNIPLLSRILGKGGRSDDEESKDIKWSSYQGFAVFAGVVILVFYTVKSERPMQSLAIGLLIAGASLAAGILIGFLFGIPRTLQKERQQSDGSNASESSAGTYGVNTNLEQISDWLTKIIVGVGLVQLTIIPGKLKALADYLATAFGTPPVPSAMVITTICYFAIFGFLLGYLWTRIYLMSEFSRVERVTRDKSEFFEGLIHAYLYQPMPTGFRNAIKEGEKYLARFGDNWRVWLYLGCAYAQEYSYLSRDPQPEQDEMKTFKAKALNAVRRVLQINPDAKALLRGLWNPEETNPLENDLEIFWAERDTNFFACLGKPGEAFPADDYSAGDA